MKAVIAILASTLFVSSALAQSMSPPPSPSDAKRDMKVERHIKELHAQLQITPAEETQWSAVAEAMRDNAAALDAAIDKRDSLIDTASAVDNLNAYGDILQAHTDAVKKLSAVFAPLYASMPNEQKTLADAVFAERGKKTANAPGQ